MKLLKRDHAPAPLPLRRQPQERPRRPLLDPDDRAALGRLAIYGVLLIVALLCILLLAMTLGEAHHLFTWAGG